MMWRFVTMIAGVSAVRLADEIGSSSQMMAATHMEGGDLEANQYVLAWHDPFGSIAMTPYITKGWEFVVPVLCRERGVWAKVNKIMGSLKGKHCMLVTCEITGAINLMALNECPRGTFSTDIWEKNKPDRVLDTSDASVALNGYVYQGPRFGAPSQHSHKNSVMDLSKTTLTELGWEFGMSSKFPASATLVFREWNGRTPNCRDTLQEWSSYDIVPRNESSLTECKLKREEKVLTCQAEWASKIGTQTAWQWKELGRPSDMKGAKLAFPYCTKWCEKEDCYTNPVPDFVTRDKEAFMKLFNSKKKDCEDELDAYAKKRMKKCEKIEGLFCFGTWDKLHPCAMTHALPDEPK